MYLWPGGDLELRQLALIGTVNGYGVDRATLCIGNGSAIRREVMIVNLSLYQPRHPCSICTDQIEAVTPRFNPCRAFWKPANLVVTKQLDNVVVSPEVSCFFCLFYHLVGDKRKAKQEVSPDEFFCCYWPHIRSVTVDDVETEIVFYAWIGVTVGL